MNMTRSFVLTSALIGSLLTAGCGGSTPPPSEPAQAATASATAPDAPATATAKSSLELRLVVSDQADGAAFPTGKGDSVRLAKDSIIGRGDIASAQADGNAVHVTLAPAAAKRFEDFTSKNVGAKLAIVVDGKVKSAPVIKAAISGGHVEVSVGSQKEAELLARSLAPATAP
jgi:preprotein translocase subunit SecD